jgi:thiol-disulfide isomerase/thioredoxin
MTQFNLSSLADALRKRVGAAAPAVVAAVALGFGASTLAQPSPTGATSNPRDATPLRLPVEGTMPPLDGAAAWLNTPPLTAEALRGKVVLVDFWTYSCINCLNALPHVREWNRKYKDQGLVVVSVHTPEFAYEKSINNVKRAVSNLDVSFPVAIDNNYAIWRAFGNNYWPAHYFVDAQGRIRFHHFGEGEYQKSEQVIQQLLEEARKEAKPL